MGTTESAQKVKDAKPDANPSATQPEKSKNQNSTKKHQNSTIEMRLIELTKIQINVKLAYLEEQRMSKSYENIFKDGRVCTHCFKNLIKPKNKCIVCCFGMCSAHQITVYLPSSFSLSDNLVHEVQESLGSIPKEKHKQFVPAPICKGCLGLVVDIKNEYFAS